MSYEIEEIRQAQEVFYQLLTQQKIEEEKNQILYRAYTENESVMHLTKNMAETSHASVECYGNVIYLLPDEDNNELGFSRNELKNILTKSTGSLKDYYLSQFVIITILTEFYDGVGSSAKSRSFMRVGELQNIISDKLKEGVNSLEEGESVKEGLAFSDMLSAYEALKSDEKGSRAKTTKEGFLYHILNFLQKQDLIIYVEEDEMITTTKKLDSFMDWNLLNQNNYDRVRRVLGYEQD